MDLPGDARVQEHGVHQRGREHRHHLRGYTKGAGVLHGARARLVLPDHHQALASRQAPADSLFFHQNTADQID